jgi:hypothetical protein
MRFSVPKEVRAHSGIWRGQATIALVLASCSATVPSDGDGGIPRTAPAADAIVEAELDRRIDVSLDRVPIREAFVELFTSTFWLRRLLVDRIQDVEVSLELHDTTVRRALDTLLARGGLERMTRAGLLFIGTPQQIADVARTWEYLQHVDSTVLERTLTIRMSMCSPSPIPFADLADFVGRFCRVQVTAEFPEDEDPLHRYECFAFDEEDFIEVRDFLRFIALDCGLGIKAEGDAVVFFKLD